MELQLATARRLLAAMAVLLALYLVLLAGQRAVDGYRARQEVATVRKAIDQLRARNVELQTYLQAEQQEQEIERVARAELGLVRPGDHPVVLIGPTSTPPQRAGPESSSGQEANWRAWLRLFAGGD